jgi:hypothetical protein
MSNSKVDRGRLFHKLHQLQKRVTLFLKTGKFKEVSELEMKEKHLIEKIKGRHGKPSDNAK